MADIKLPYIAWRDGRPRFQPGPRERALGFRNEDLKHGDGPKRGQWFSLDETKIYAEMRRAEIHSVRASGRKLRMPARAAGRTVEDLLEDFLKSGRFRRSRADGGYAAKTADDYRKKADAIIWKPQMAADRKAGRDRIKEEFACAPARDITPGTISNDEGGFFEYLRRERGLSTARGAIMVLSAAYKWARKASAWQIEHNPCTRLGLRKPQPAVAVTYTMDEFAALVAYGDHPAIAMHSVVDAAFIALFSGQRPGDVRALDGGGTSDGVTRLVQSKRGRRVEVAQLPPLTGRLAAMAERRKAKGWTDAALVINPNTGKGYTESVLQHHFEDLRAMMIAGRPDLGLAAVPSIAGKSMKHFRKTLLTWIKRAKVPDNQFAAVSGHALASLPQVMPHYYTPGSEDAAEAMATVWAWMQEQGMTG